MNENIAKIRLEATQKATMRCRDVFFVFLTLFWLITCCSNKTQTINEDDSCPVNNKQQETVQTNLKRENLKYKMPPIEEIPRSGAEDITLTSPIQLPWTNPFMPTTQPLPWSSITSILESIKKEHKDELYIGTFPNDSDVIPSGCFAPGNYLQLSNLKINQNTEAEQIKRSNEAIDKLSPKVIKFVGCIYVEDTFGITKPTGGTGILANDGFFYTAAHVISGYDKATIAFLGYAQPYKVNLRDAKTVLEVDFDRDLARIKNPELNKYQSSISISNIELSRSPFLFAIGFWWDSPDVENRVIEDIESRNDDEVKKYKVKNQFKEYWKKYKGKFIVTACYIAPDVVAQPYLTAKESFKYNNQIKNINVQYSDDLIINASLLIAGCSGAPIFDKHANLVGIHVGSRKTTDGNMFRLMKNAKWWKVQPIP